LIAYVVDTGIDTLSQVSLIAGVVVTSDKFITGVNDTGEQL
jgi:hypothetical protein